MGERIDEDDSSDIVPSVVQDESDCDSSVRSFVPRHGPLPTATAPFPLAPMCGQLLLDELEDDEDDDSITLGSNSTTTSRSLDPTPKAQARSRTRVPGRRIRFPPDESIATYKEGAEMEILAEHRLDIWYQYEELKNIKRKALAVSKEAQKYGLGHVLTNTYGKSCQETQEALNLWARNGSSRRGLERWINDEYAAKRSDIRKRTIQSVIRAQTKMKDSALKDPDYSSKVLSRLSEAFSVDSTKFARGMGIADSLAVDVDEQQRREATTIEKKKLGGVTRKHTTKTVLGGMPMSPSKPSRNTSRKAGLTVPSVSADFRHYF